MGLSQERLCAGVCGPLALSRFERGEQTLSNRRMRTLLQRVGLSSDRFYALLSEDEIALEEAERKARNASVALQRAAAADRPSAWRQFRKALEHLESLGPEDPFIRQCSLSLRATMGTEEGPYSFAKRLAMQLEAIRLTVPWFDTTNVSLGPYSTEEWRLVDHIAATYVLGKQYAEAVRIYRAALEYLEANGYRLPQYPILRAWVIYGYSSALRLMGHFQEALDTAATGWRSCVESGHYITLGYLLWLQANCHHSLGNAQKCAEFLYQAHYVLKATGDEYQLPLLDADAQKWCGITFLY